MSMPTTRHTLSVRILRDTVYVCDRHNGHIFCFNLLNGRLRRCDSIPDEARIDRRITFQRIGSKTNDGDAKLSPPIYSRPQRPNCPGTVSKVSVPLPSGTWTFRFPDPCKKMWVKVRGSSQCATCGKRRTLYIGHTHRVLPITSRVGCGLCGYELFTKSNCRKCQLEAM